MPSKKVFKLWSMNVLYLCDILKWKNSGLPFKITLNLARMLEAPGVFEQMEYSSVQCQLTSFSIGKEVQQK